MGSMNLEEFLKSWTPETNQPPSPGIEPGNGSSVNLSDKIGDDEEVWREIKGNGDGEIKREHSIVEMTLEDFLTKEGAIDECGIMPLDVASQQCFSQQLSLSPAPSIGALSDTPISGRRRGPTGMLERGVEKKLKRKIKNRESAARSRARKQAYHNELVSKVSRLEEQNMRLKKEKELENRIYCDLGNQPRYQLRRTSSTIF